MRRSLLALLTFMLACETSTDVIAIDQFQAGLAGSRVRPDSIATPGSGTLTITLRSDTTALRYELTYAGLTSAAIAAHLHGPAADSTIAGVLLDFAALPQGRSGTLQLGTSGTAAGSIDLAANVNSMVTGDSLFKLLHAGLLYVDVHTGQNSAGEIRGQVGK